MSRSHIVLLLFLWLLLLLLQLLLLLLQQRSEQSVVSFLSRCFRGQDPSRKSRHRADPVPDGSGWTLTRDFGSGRGRKSRNASLPIMSNTIPILFYGRVPLCRLFTLSTPKITLIPDFLTAFGHQKPPFLLYLTPVWDLLLRPKKSSK